MSALSPDENLTLAGRLCKQAAQCYVQADYGAARSLIICEQALGARHPMMVKSLRKVVAVLGNLHHQGDEKALLMGIPLHTCLMALEAAAGTLSPDNQHMPGTHLNPDQAAEQLQ
jgi:hypothetical protein